MPEPASAIVELLGRVYAATDPDAGDRTSVAVAIDLDAARDLLGLADDADPSEWDPGVDAERRFSFTAGAVIPHLARPSETPMHDALDLGRASPAASNAFFGNESITLIVTEQPFDETVSVLVDAGYQRDGDLLSYQGSEPLLGGVVYSDVLYRDGVVALTRDQTGRGAATLERALGGDRRPVPSEALIVELGAPALGVVVSRDDACVETVVVADPLDGSDADLILVAHDDPADIDVVINEPDGSQQRLRLEFGKEVVEETHVRVPITMTAARPPLTLLTGDSARSIWECR